MSRLFTDHFSDSDSVSNSISCAASALCSGVLFCSAILSPIAANAATSSAQPTSDQLWQMIQTQKNEIEQLKTKQTEMIEQTKKSTEQTDATVAALEEVKNQSKPHVHIGGYGELHYNLLENQKEGGKDKKEIDLHRLVFFFGHDFSERMRFFSEIEYEHADTTKKGAVEVEQAFVEFDLNEKYQARGGLFLLPIGILNQTHEPPTFYGVERNPVENKIIPTTWWVGGAGFSGRITDTLQFDTAIHEGFKASATDKYAVRNARQKTSEAVAHDLAFTGQIKWRAHPSVELAAATQLQPDIDQNTDASADSASLYETHAIVQMGAFQFKTLYAHWDLQGDGPKAVGADQQNGYYIEPSYKISERIGVFSRFNAWDNEAGDNVDSKYTQVDVGLNYWPHENVVLKVDYQDQSVPNSKDELDGINASIGYQF